MTTPLDADAIAAWQARQEIAQAEYRAHPFAASCVFGCPCERRRRQRAATVERYAARQRVKAFMQARAKEAP